MPPYYEIVALLVAAGAPVEPGWLSDENAQANKHVRGAQWQNPRFLSEW